MKLLIVTNLFPSSVEPGRGLFNQQQFLALARHCELRVVSPVPWFPRGRWLRKLRPWSRYAEVPSRETIAGLEVHHPRYLVIPKLARWLHAFTYRLGIDRTVTALRREFAFDAILATWAYPDVVASVGIAARIGVPVVAKVHGSDLNVLAQGRLRRRMIAGALRRCAAVVAVSSGLKQHVVNLGVPEDRVTVIPNGVDVGRFRPLDRFVCRRRLGLPEQGRRVVFIGHLTPVKGLNVLLEALSDLPAEVSLSLVGEGEERGRLEALAAAQGLRDRVTFVGARPHDEVPLWMNASDIVCLPSLNEGCPNVVLEALACGRRVVATAVGGIPDLLSDPRAGRLVPPGNTRALAEALQECLGRTGTPEDSRQASALPGWSESAGQVARIVEEVLRGKAA